MKTKQQRLTFLVIILSLLMVSVTACGGGGGTGTDPGPDPDPDPDPDPPSISFDSGTLSPGDSYSYTFDNTGSVDYLCTFHPSSMQGSVSVEDGASTDDVTVTIEGLSFGSNADITIGPGTTVTWVNNDDINHTATSQ